MDGHLPLPFPLHHSGPLTDGTIPTGQLLIGPALAQVTMDGSELTFLSSTSLTMSDAKFQVRRYDFYGNTLPSGYPSGWQWFGVSIGWQPPSSWACPSKNWTPPAPWISQCGLATWWTPSWEWTPPSSLSPPPFWSSNGWQNPSWPTSSWSCSGSGEDGWELSDFTNVLTPFTDDLVGSDGTRMVILVQGTSDGTGSEKVMVGCLTKTGNHLEAPGTCLRGLFLRSQTARGGVSTFRLTHRHCHCSILTLASLSISSSELLAIAMERFPSRLLAGPWMGLWM